MGKTNFGKNAKKTHNAREKGSCTQGLKEFLHKMTTNPSFNQNMDIKDYELVTYNLSCKEV